MILTRLIVVLLITVSHMQAGIVSGTVRDKDTQKALPNVNINVLESDFGAVSDPYGNYKLEIEGGTYQLEFSMIGFKPIVENINIQNIMSNSFGFGGTNATLVFSKYNA